MDCIQFITVHFVVTDTPTNFTLERAGLFQALFTWSAPDSNDPMVEGYEVFYNLSNGTRFTELYSTTVPTIKIVDPELGYSAFIVAFGGDLPSEASNVNNTGEGEI